MPRLFKKLFEKLFKKRTDKKDASALPDDIVCGNTAGLNKSLEISLARRTAKVFCPGIDVADCSKKEQDALAAMGLAAYWMACGFHASEEDVTQLKKYFNSSDTEAP